LRESRANFEAYISETGDRNPINMVLKLVRNYRAKSNGEGFETTRGRIRDQDLD